VGIEEKKLNRRQFATAGAAAAAAVATAGTLLTRGAAAQEASPAAEEGGMPPLPEGAIVVAEGLWNPANLAFDADGNLYVAEGGIPGAGPEGDGTPVAAGTAAPAPLVDGQVSKIAPDGSVSVLATGLLGAVGIKAAGGTLYVSSGGGSIGSGLSPLPIENTVNAIDLASGAVTQLASLGGYEAENNPDGTDVNPNLYGLDVNADGQLFVADAGGNTIYQVNTATGDFSLFAIVPNLAALTNATPAAGEEVRQPVPTSVNIDANGNIVVGLLSEFWEGPSIVTFAPDATWTAGPGGLSFFVSATIGPDGLLYATQLSDDFSGEAPAPGSVKRVLADGTIETVVEGILFPHGLAFDTAGNLYVTANSIISGPDAPLGQVLRFDGVISA
jgi:sugar lactone lactonase YvrE